MAAQGELYKHKSVKDSVYRVEKVDTPGKRVYVRNTKSPNEGLWVSLNDLNNSYRKA